MAKMFGGAAPMTANGSPGGIRPMARPAGLGGVETGMAPRESWLGPMSAQRYDMAMGLLKSAMSGAAGSNNPALAFLTPIIGGITGAKLTDKRDTAVAEGAADMAGGLLGEQISPQAQQAMDVLNSPDAPDYLKQIAMTMLKKSVPFGSAAGGGGRGGRRRSGGGASAAAGSGPGPKGRLVGEYDIGGVIHGRDSAGVLWPYKTADGAVAGTTPKGRPSVATAPLPAAPPDPVIPTDPGLTAGNSDDELIKKYLGQ